MFTPPEPAYPCGCAYSSWNDLGLPCALVRECAEHAIVTEMTSIVRAEAHRISLEVSDD